MAPNKLILGTWEAVSGEALGKQILGKEAWGMRITFAKDKAIWHFHKGEGWQSFDAVCRIDPGGNVGWIDLGQPNSKDPPQLALGIYKVDAQILEISVGKERPSSFDQPSLSKMTFKRMK
jgi:uncharacterized protein (TIGR03067 family)